MSSERRSGPLRVAQVIGSFERGGAQRQAFNLVCGLRDIGVDAKGVAVRHVGDFVRWSEHEEHFVELGADRSRPATVVRALLRLRRWLRTWRPHVIHAQGTTSLPFVWQALRLWKSRPLLFFTWQDSGRVLHQTGKTRRSFLRALRACHAVFGSSADVARRLAVASDLPHVGVFHGGVPEQPRSQPVTPPTIMWVGRFDPVKGPERLIGAAERLKEAGAAFRVVMVGGTLPGSSYLEQARSAVRAAGLEDRLRLAGYVDEAELESLYRDAAIGVQTSHTEGLSMVLLEQMMRGLAIVATDVGDSRTALADGRCGVLVPRDSGAAVFADAIATLVTDEEARQRLGVAGRERALSHYSVQAMARRARGIYEAALCDEGEEAT